MPDCFGDLFRNRLTPLEPIPTGEEPATVVLPGLRAVLLWVTGGIVRLLDSRIPADGSISADELRTAVRIGLSEGCPTRRSAT